MMSHRFSSDGSVTLSKIVFRKVEIFPESSRQIAIEKDDISMATLLKDTSISLVSSKPEQDDDEEEIFEDAGDTTLNADSIPKANISTKFSFSNFVSMSQEESDTDHISPFDSEDANLWKLSSALWDNIQLLESTDGLTEEQKEVLVEAVRKEEFSTWLKWSLQAYTRAVVLASPSSDRLTWIYLATRQLGNAVKAALSAKNLKLASLLAQVGGSSSSVLINRGGTSKISRNSSGHGVLGKSGTDTGFSADVTHQVELWKRAGANLLDEDINKIWRLLTGNVDLWEPLLFKDFTNWKQAFGILFWFADGGHFSIGETMDLFELLRQKIPSSILEPVPGYSPSGGSLDMCYHLIKVFVDESYTLERTLNPLCISPNRMDYLNSWLLYLCLSRVKQVRDFQDARTEIISQRQTDMNEDSIFYPTITATSLTGDRVTTNVAHQLEALGLWKWAIFASLFLNHHPDREYVVKGILARNYPLDDHSGSWFSDLKSSQVESSHIWKFLGERLKVPTDWIHEARALRARYMNNPVQEAVSLVDAHQYDSCHRLLIEKLAPVSIFSGIIQPRDMSNNTGNFTFVKNVLDQLPQDSLNQWVPGGNLLLEYISIVDQVPVLLQKSELLKCSSHESQNDIQIHLIKTQATQELRDAWSQRVKDLYRFTLVVAQQTENCWQVTEISRMALSFMTEKLGHLVKEIARILETDAHQVFSANDEGILQDDRLSQIYTQSSDWFLESISAK